MTEAEGATGGQALHSPTSASTLEDLKETLKLLLPRKLSGQDKVTTLDRFAFLPKLEASGESLFSTLEPDFLEQVQRELGEQRATLKPHQLLAA